MYICTDIYMYMHEYRTTFILHTLLLLGARYIDCLLIAYADVMGPGPMPPPMSLAL